MSNINLKKPRFALKNALILTYATSTIVFIAINIIVRILSYTGGVGYGGVPLDLAFGEGDLLGYYWANLSLYSQIFSWVFAITLIQIIIEKNVIKKSS